MDEFINVISFISMIFGWFLYYWRINQLKYLVNEKLVNVINFLRTCNSDIRKFLDGYHLRWHPI